MMQTSSTSPVAHIEDALDTSVDDLSEALASSAPGNEREWTKRVAEALAQVEHHLRRHAAETRSPDGPLAEVDLTRPTLARQAAGLRRDYDELLKQCLALQEGVRRAAAAFAPTEALQSPKRPPTSKDSPIPDFGALRDQAAPLLEELRRKKEAEIDLVQESVTTDIGVGD
jgi:hypothetical protein